MLALRGVELATATVDVVFEGPQCPAPLSCDTGAFLGVAPDDTGGYPDGLVGDVNMNIAAVAGPILEIGINNGGNVAPYDSIDIAAGTLTHLRLTSAGAVTAARDTQANVTVSITPPAPVAGDLALYFSDTTATFDSITAIATDPRARRRGSSARGASRPRRGTRTRCGSRAGAGRRRTRTRRC